MKPIDGTDNAKELTADYVRSLLPGRPDDSNKATFGSVLNVAGSVNYRGAACLSSLSALKVGAGYVTLACPDVIAGGISSYSPDIVIIPLKTRDGCIDKNGYREIVRILPKYSVLSVGCGLSSVSGGRDRVRAFFSGLISSVSALNIPVMIDADGLNLLAELPSAVLPKNTVLTPHPKELSRLLNVEVGEIQSDRILYAQQAARRFGSVVVLKGHRTIITDGTDTWINVTGNSALAKAGTGDVLTGMISGFCAQGLSPRDSACLGAYLHGMAGDLAGAELTEYGVLASDLLSYIPAAIKTLV